MLKKIAIFFKALFFFIKPLFSKYFMNEWTESFKSCFKSKNHLLVLNELYDSAKSLNEIKSINKKTAYRILNFLYDKGLVGKDGEKICLTNKGRLLAYMVFGNFKELKMNKEESQVFEPKTAYVEKKEVISKLLNNSQRKISTLILAESGLGKTMLLKHLNKNYLKKSAYSSVKPIKLALEEILRVSGQELRKGLRINEMINIIKNSKPDVILLMDELELSTSQSNKVLKELKRSGITIIGAGQFMKDASIFADKIKLAGLTDEEAKSLTGQILGNKYPNLDEVNRIVKQNTNNNPEQITDICKTAITLTELKEDANIQDKIKPTNKKINLISTNDLVNIAYLLITLRYIFYGQKEYQIGYTLSTIAYLIFFFFRRKKK
jgi:Fe2+ or Zn2+ uptake regulation protein